jgi:DNA primase
MARYSSDTIQEIKDRVSLLDVVRPAVNKLQRKGNNWWACCPFHQEKTPSFSVREDEGFYHCFGCGAHGDVFSFVQETRGGDFNDAIEHLAGIAGIQLKQEQVDPRLEARRNDGYAALEAAQKFYTSNLAGSAQAYLENRGISEQTIAEFSLGWVEDGWRGVADHLTQQSFKPEILRETGLTLKSDKGKDDYDRFRGRVMFPIQNLKQQVVGFGGRVLGDGEPKYLNSSETPFFHKSQILYNLNRARDHIRKTNTALLVEGYMDVIGLWQQGIKTAVASCGTAVTPEQIQLLWRFHKAPVVCLDGDRAGRQAAERLAERILPVLNPGKTLKFMFLPDGEDPDSFVQSSGADAFNSLLKQAQSLEDVLWAHIQVGTDLAEGQGRAEVEEKISGVVKATTNPTLSKHLNGALRDRLWQTIRRKRSGGTQKSVNKTKQIPAANLSDTGRLILGALCSKPEWLVRNSEVLAGITFADPQQQALMQALFRALVEKRLEKDELDAYLMACGLEDEVSDLTRDQRLQSLLLRADAETVWQQMCAERLQRQQAQAEKQAKLKQLAVALGANEPI